jgi:hypothetical protein
MTRRKPARAHRSSPMRRLLPLALLLVIGCAKPRPHVPPPQFSDVVDYLAPGGVAEPARLRGLPKKRARALLLDAQPQATGRRAVNIAYLLVLLRHDRKENRARLVSAMQSCWLDPAARCEPLAARYLAELAAHGDSRLLPPLLDAGTRDAPALAAPLGEFYGDLLLDDPRAFLARIRKWPAADQRRIAALAAAAPRRGASGGLSPAMRRDVMRDLEAITRRKRDKLTPAARIFLAAFASAPAR